MLSVHLPFQSNPHHFLLLVHELSSLLQNIFWQFHLLQKFKMQYIPRDISAPSGEH